ncbi:MAG: hypothetical protein L3J20_01925 [Flavobacteriaceae bacterium]|nr:hypothetical protein [Flavobacteriaceae bacterium]
MNKIWQLSALEKFSLTKAMGNFYVLIITKFLAPLKRHSTLNLVLVFFLWNSGSIYGQKLILEISAKDSVNTIFTNSIQYQKTHLSEISLFNSLDSIKNKLTQKGFLNFSLDTIKKRDSIYHAQFDLGNINKTVRIYYSNNDIDKEQLFRLAPSVKDTHFDILTEGLSRTLKAIVEIFETQGNSFTQVSLKNITVKKDLIEGTLSVKKSKLRKIDKIVINGYKDFPQTYLNHFLKLKNNIVFNRNKLDKVSELITILPFVTEIKPPEVLFTKDSTIVYLYLKKKASNKFDGLVGFTSKEDGSGISFNGYLDLLLNNVFNSGESFSLNWKNNGDERQVFNLSATIPYIFNSSFSPEATLNIYKQDSTFINTKTKFSLPYAIDERNAVGISLYTETSSNLLTNNMNNEIDDFNTVFYGINYKYQIPNNQFLFPVKFNIFSEVLTGNRKTDGNNFRQSKFYFKTNYLWSLNFKNHIYLQNETGTLLSDNILTNELFRIGGVNSIRGFDEESIFASTYSFFTIEYRFTPNNNSYLYSITDLGYIDNEIINQSSQIYSLGLGYAFTTKLGVLNLSYALGKFSNQPFDFGNSRFHLKVISFF